MRAPLHDPLMKGFVEGLEPINALADMEAEAYGGAACD